MTEKLKQTVETDSVHKNNNINREEEAMDIITDKDDARQVETEQETAPAWDLSSTADSTSLSQVTEIIVEDDGDLLGGSDDIDQLEAFLSGETEFENNEQKLQAGQQILRNFYAKHNQAWAGIIGTFSVYAIQQGKLLISLKKLVKDCGRTWGLWAADNLGFMHERTRQSFMQIASTPGVEKHTYLGKERLILLSNVTNGIDSEDPIGDLLGRHNLRPDPTEEIDLDAYKKAVDVAIFYERLKKVDVEVNIETIRKYYADKKPLNADLIKILKAIKNSGGNPEEHLSAPPDDDDTIDGQKKAMSFKKIAISLLGTISWISNHTEFIDKIDIDKIDELTENLNTLKRLVEESTTPKESQ